MLLGIMGSELPPILSWWSLPNRKGLHFASKKCHSKKAETWLDTAHLSRTSFSNFFLTSRSELDLLALWSSSSTCKVSLLAVSSSGCGGTLKGMNACRMVAFGMQPISPRACAAAARTELFWSASASTNFGTTSTASGPIAPRACAALALTPRCWSASASTNSSTSWAAAPGGRWDDSVELLGPPRTSAAWVAWVVSKWLMFIFSNGDNFLISSPPSFSRS